MDDGVNRAIESQRLRDVVPDEPEPQLACQVRQITFGAGQKIVEANDGVAFSQQPVAHVRADKARGP